MKRADVHRIKRVGWIALAVCALHLSALVMRADDYVEDVYFWSDAPAQDESGAIVPNYNRRVRELIFVEDSVSQQKPDTVVTLILREAPL